METTDNGIVNPTASGNDGETLGTDGSKDAVSYESFQKLVAQRKKDREKLEKYQSELTELKGWKSKLDEEESAKKGEFDKILSNYKAENQKLQSELTEYKQNLVNGMKLQAFLDKLPGQIESQDYYQFADLDEIALDPDTGAVDPQTLEFAVNKFVKKHSRLITPKTNRQLPGHSHVGPISYKAKAVSEMSREELRKAFIESNE